MTCITLACGTSPVSNVTSAISAELVFVATTRKGCNGEDGSLDASETWCRQISQPCLNVSSKTPVSPHHPNFFLFQSLPNHAATQNLQCCLCFNRTNLERLDKIHPLIKRKKERKKAHTNYMLLSQCDTQVSATRSQHSLDLHKFAVRIHVYHKSKKKNWLTL